MKGLSGLAARYGARGVYHKILRRDTRRTTLLEASPQLILGEAAPETFLIRENGLKFQLSFREGYSVGLFLDQRDNRRRFLTNHIAGGFPLFGSGADGTEMLNTFAYTCGFGVCAAAAGARTTNLDLSRKYLDRGKRNYQLNGLHLAKHDFVFGDAFDWLRRLGRKARLFDAIVLDPPTFSRSKERRFQAEKNFGELVREAAPLLKPGGVLLACSNAARWEPEAFLGTVGEAIKRAGRSIVRHHYVAQPPDFPVHRAEPAYLKTVWQQLA
jgi:23S rRNA (cytosine1962-C5)-methyltransferase